MGAMSSKIEKMEVQISKEIEENATKILLIEEKVK
jgi:hypothetical protein